ncbi:MAG: Xaa-Pro peptidase family protein [Planctomycetota bacterium]
MSVRQPVAKPKAYLKARHKQTEAALDALDLDAILLTHPADLAYLTNFTGDDSVGIFKPGGEVWLVTDFRYTEQAELEAAWLKVVERKGDIHKMSDALAHTLREAGLTRVGFEANFTTVGQKDAVEEALDELDYDCELVAVEDVMVKQRKVKDDHEIDLIRKACDVAEEAFNAVRDSIQAGETEGYLAGLLSLEMKSRGATDPSFSPIVATAGNSSLPHYRPDDTLIQKDNLLLFDWGARVNGYCSDMTRTFAIGRVPAKLKEIYNVTLEAQQAAIEYIRPGVSCLAVDKVARDHIKKAGYEKYFGHGLGHGLGRDIHELPVLRKQGEDDELRPGMVVTVEPGIYLPGQGGVRIEDDVLVTHSGREILTSLPKAFEDCHIE